MNLPRIDQDYPFQVELPPAEDAVRAGRMKDFCKSVDYRVRTEGTRYRWCFRQPRLAKWFMDEFGGTYFDLSE